MSPVKPSELRELVPTDEDNICEIFVKVMKFMLLYYRHHRYMWNDDGTLTAAWEYNVCTNINEHWDEIQRINGG